jgi:hypothetical protein
MILILIVLSLLVYYSTTYSSSTSSRSTPPRRTTKNTRVKTVGSVLLIWRDRSSSQHQELAAAPGPGQQEEDKLDIGWWLLVLVENREQWRRMKSNNPLHPLQ